MIARSYPVQMQMRAREMRAAGFSAPAIHRNFQRAGGPVPSVFTIYAWTDQQRLEYARTAAAKFNRQRSAQNATFALRSDTPEYRQAFMVALRKEGVPMRSIARVHQVVFGEPIDEKTVKVRIAEAAA